MNRKPWNLKSCLTAMAIIGLFVFPARSQETANDQKTPPDKRTTEEDELTRRLKNAATGHGEETFLDRMLEYMLQSRNRLGEQYDPGAPTQAIQKKIVDSLDEAIEQARKNTSSSRSSSSRNNKQDGKNRKRNRPKPEPSKGDSAQPKPSEGPATENREGGAKGAVRSGKLGGVLRESGREWGKLPSRDREEVVQGIRENVLLKYREVIEKYYRALAEQADR